LIIDISFVEGAVVLADLSENNNLYVCTPEGYENVYMGEFQHPEYIEKIALRKSKKLLLKLAN